MVFVIFICKPDVSFTDGESAKLCRVGAYGGKRRYKLDCIGYVIEAHYPEIRTYSYAEGFYMRIYEFGYHVIGADYCVRRRREAKKTVCF